MSDVFQGPGWWLASDGKWYAPSTHPDESYREAFADVEAPEASAIADDAAAATDLADVGDVGDFPSVEITLPTEGSRDAAASEPPSVIRAASQRSEPTQKVVAPAGVRSSETSEEQPAVVAAAAGAGSDGASAEPPEIPPEAEHAALVDDADDADDAERNADELDTAESIALERSAFEPPVVAPLPDASAEHDAVATDEPTVVEADAAESADDDSVRSGWSPIAPDTPPAAEAPVEEPPVVDDVSAPDATTVAAASAQSMTSGKVLEEARKERLAQAQKVAEGLRDTARAARLANDDLAFVDEFESVAEAQSVGQPTAGVRVPGAPANGVSTGTPVVAGRTKLEVQSTGSRNGAGTTFALASEPVVSTTTDLIHVPADVKPVIDVMDRVLSVLVFLSGLAMIAGTFMVWTSGPADQLGWDRSDGIVAVASGVVAATAAGPLFVGIRFLARPMAILSGVVALMVVGVVGVTTLTDAERTGLMLGNGLFTVLAGALAAILAGAALRNEPVY